MNTLQFTKNDIWRILGIVLLVAGQFMSKESYSGVGITMESNLVQIIGALLLMYPFLVKIIALYKNKKIKKEDSQG